MKKITLSLIILFVALSGCSGLNRQLKFMDQLKDSISEKYQTEKIDINIRNNDKLTVSLKDPKFDDYSSDRKEQVAREIGKMVRELEYFPEQIKTGLVKFVNEKKSGIAKTSSSHLYNMYE